MWMTKQRSGKEWREVTTTEREWEKGGRDFGEARNSMVGSSHETVTQIPNQAEIIILIDM